MKINVKINVSLYKYFIPIFNGVIVLIEWTAANLIWNKVLPNVRPGDEKHLAILSSVLLMIHSIINIGSIIFFMHNDTTNFKIFDKIQKDALIPLIMFIVASSLSPIFLWCAKNNVFNPVDAVFSIIGFISILISAIWLTCLGFSQKECP